MKSIVIFFLLIIYSANLNSGILKMDVAGTFKTTVIKLLDNSSFITYFSKSTIITNVDVYASAECNGIVERKEVESKTNIMCLIKENDESFFYGHFNDIYTTGRNISEWKIVSAQGRWKELVGVKCIGADSPVELKETDDRGIKGKSYEGHYLWLGKCDVPDDILTRIKNYKSG